MLNGGLFKENIRKGEKNPKNFIIFFYLDEKSRSEIYDYKQLIKRHVLALADLIKLFI